MIQLFAVISVILFLLLSWFFQKRIRQKKAFQVHSWFFLYSRRTVYALALLWILVLYYHAVYVFPSISAALSTLTRWYALSALFSLFFVLIPGLLATFFPGFFLNGVLVYTRRAVGQSMFLFAILHIGIAFFNNLSGSFSSIFFLSPGNQTALVLSGIALVFFCLMAATSFDSMVKRIGGRTWKRIHRLVYAAILLILFHAYLIGSHYTNSAGLIPMLTNYLALTFFLLEITATVFRSRKIFPEKSYMKKFVISGSIVICVLGAFVISYRAATFSYDPHAIHRINYADRFLLTITSNPEYPQPNTPVELTFSVYDKRRKTKVTKFRITHDKLMHVVILRSDLITYDHIHPTLDKNGTFHVTTTFPTKGVYMLYAEYSPPDIAEVVSPVRYTVDNGQMIKAKLIPDGKTKVFDGKYKITLDAPSEIHVNDTVDLTLTLTDATTGQPIRDLEPYLAAFAHMAAVSEDLATYAHIHPLVSPTSPSDRGGPTVGFTTFFPKAGFYKIFTQFQRNGKLFVTDFVISVL